MVNKATSQHARSKGERREGSRILARLKGLANGVNPKWWPKTVVVFKSTGHILRLEDLRKKRTQK